MKSKLYNKQTNKKSKWNHNEGKIKFKKFPNIIISILTINTNDSSSYIKI